MSDRANQNPWNYLLFVAALAAYSAIATAETPVTGVSFQDRPATSAGADQRIIYIDPQTGERTAPPANPNKSLDADTLRALSTSHDGLVIEDSPVTGGGKVVNLQGRFGHALFATKKPDERIETQHSVPAQLPVPETAPVTR
jgi:hypothetical protein